MGTGEIRVAAVEDQPLTLLGMETAVQAAKAPITLVGAAPSVAALDLRRLKVHVVVLALRLQDGSDPKENVVHLRRSGAHVLVQSDGSHLATLSEALRAGARGIFLKHQPIPQFIDAVTSVGSGASYLSAELAAMLHESVMSRPQLTTREIEVLSLLYRGLVTKQVARKLDLQESTIKEHLKRIRAKYSSLGRPVSTRIELLQRAAEDGYIGTKLDLSPERRLATR